MRAHLLRKNYSRNFSSIRSGPLFVISACCFNASISLFICTHILYITVSFVSAAESDWLLWSVIIVSNTLRAVSDIRGAFNM